MAFLAPTLLPVRGLVLQRMFYLGCPSVPRAWLKTWISGQIRRVEQTTVIDVAIGPNRVAGLFFLLLAVLLGAAATSATVLAVTSPFESWRSVCSSWAVVATFLAVFFVFPASNHASDRAFLLEHVRRTLEATERGRS